MKSDKEVRCISCNQVVEVKSIASMISVGCLCASTTINYNPNQRWQIVKKSQA